MLDACQRGLVRKLKALFKDHEMVKKDLVHGYVTDEAKERTHRLMK